MSSDPRPVGVNIRVASRSSQVEPEVALSILREFTCREAKAEAEAQHLSYDPRCTYEPFTEREPFRVKMKELGVDEASISTYLTVWDHQVNPIAIIHSIDLILDEHVH
jgi:hypothetical protein